MVNQKLKGRAVHRAKIIKGQLEVLIGAIEKEEYCPTLLEQSLSIQRSLKSLDAFLLENHLKTHVMHQLEHNEKRTMKELVDLYVLSSKN